jgi:multicomponent Na+:H+ antiporter subunit B
MLSIQILILFMIAAALIAIEAEDFFASVIALGVMGLELSLVFLLLKAPDVAVIILVLEMLGLAVFAKTVASHKPKEFRDLDVFSAITFAAFAALFTMICVKAFNELPVFGSPVMTLSDEYAARSMGSTGTANIVSAIAFNFRAFDSLIVLMVLFLTAMGIFHIIRKNK